MPTQRQIEAIRYRSVSLTGDVIQHMIRDANTTEGTYGAPEKSYTTGQTYSVGVAFSPFKFRSREIGNEVGEQVAEIHARVRASFDLYNVVNKDDRIIHVKSFGNTLSPPVVYEVQGFDEITIAGVIINLKRAEL